MSIQELELKINPLAERAKAFLILTAEHFQAAGELVKAMKAMRAEIDATFDPIIKAAHLAHKEAIEQKRIKETPLVEAEKILGPRMEQWDREQERLRLEEERRLQQKAKDEEERRQLENASILHELGEVDEANRLLDEPVEVPTVRLERRPMKVGGIGFATRWSAEVVDLMALVKAVAAGRAPIQCLQADMVFLNRQAVAMRDALQYPGVRAKSNRGLQTRKA